MSPLAAALLLVLFAVRIVSVVVCFKKRKPVFGLIGIVAPLFALIGAGRLAKPSSNWALRYNDTTMAEAMARFPKDPLVEAVSTRKRVDELIPGDRVGNPTGMQYEVTSSPVVKGEELTYDVVLANGDAGTRTWLSDEGSKQRLMWNPHAVADLAAAR